MYITCVVVSGSVCGCVSRMHKQPTATADCVSMSGAAAKKRTSLLGSSSAGMLVVSSTTCCLVFATSSSAASNTALRLATCPKEVSKSKNNVSFLMYELHLECM
jgi:hypothetical protein